MFINYYIEIVGLKNLCNQKFFFSVWTVTNFKLFKRIKIEIKSFPLNFKFDQNF